MRNITDFVEWLVGASAPELALIKAVTGHDGLPLDGLTFPADGHDFSRVVDLVEKHNLYPYLCLVTDDPMWWKIVANFGSLVALLDTAEPRWRDGEHVEPVKVDRAITRLYDRPERPRRILLDMDGPLTAFDDRCFEVCVDNGWELDIDAPGDQVYRYIADHLPNPDHQAKLRSLIDSPGWYQRLPVTPGAVEGVEQMLAAGHEVVVCSKPHDASPDCMREKLAWLGEHFPMLTEYVFTRDKSLANANAYGAQGILLDDAIEHRQVQSATWEPVVFGVPFNRPGSKWGCFPRWTWGDPIERLSW